MNTASYGLLDRSRNVLTYIDDVSDTYDFGNFYSPFLTPDKEHFGRNLKLYSVETMSEAASILVFNMDSYSVSWESKKKPGLGFYRMKDLQIVKITEDGWEVPQCPDFTIDDILSLLEQPEVKSLRVIEAMIGCVTSPDKGHLIPVSFTDRRTFSSSKEWAVCDLRKVSECQFLRMYETPISQDIASLDFSHCLKSVDNAIVWANKLNLNSNVLLGNAVRNTESNVPSEIARHLVIEGLKALN